MKFTKKLMVGAIAAATVSTASFAPVANAEVSGSVAISNMYLWRGFNLGDVSNSDDDRDSFGSGAISGSLDYSVEGFYAGIWGSSGDASAGTEYDLYVGYGGEVGDFSYDAFIVNYIYPSGPFSETESFGDFMEVVVTLGYGPVSFSYYDNIAGDTGGYAASEDYTYMTLSAEFGAFSALYGKHDEGFNNDSHLDLSYGYNDNLSFTISLPVDNDAEDDTREPLFVVSYSLPIE